ncbi:olfactory receptor 4B13-like [Channa argus]|uniref:olfactory receptor 4B13-like n=1 Tax=Channa argus TaxID=215402 RepID=UPI00352064BA
MDDQLNITYITFNGYVEVHKYRYVYFMILFTVYVLIICSNSTIVYLIWIHKSLHEPMYIFIAALLINSVLYSTNIYPKLLTDVLSDKQIISYSACLFQWFAYYSLGGSEFLLLAVMSYDRYVSICKPLQYPTIMRRTTINLLLLFSWLVPGCHVAVTVAWSADKKLCGFNLKGIFCNNSVYELHCVSSRALSVYGVIVLFNIALFPMLFIVVTYINIFVICYRSSRDVRKKAAETCTPHLLVLIGFSCLSVYDVVILRVETDFPKTARLIMTLQMVLYNPLFNPIIYGLKLKEISKHIKKFCAKAKWIQT